jgi:hypothetical protein
VIRPITRPGDFQAGVSLLVYDNDQLVSLKAGTVLNQLVRMGANSVAVVFPFFQDSSYSSTMGTGGGQTPTVDTLRAVIKEAHRRHFSVMLRPLLDETNIRTQVSWRGGIRPTSVSAWFQNYQAFLLPYLQLATSERVESFDVGTELETLQGKVTDWRGLIAAVRQVYPGQVTYSQNWDTPGPVRFAPDLDYLSVDAYYPLDAPANASAQQIATAWQPWIRVLAGWGRAAGKPIVLTEVGTASQPNSYQQPFKRPAGAPVDLQAQAVYYRGTCQSVPSTVAGLYWWEVELDPRAQPQLDPGFNFLGKPAQLEVAACFLPSTRRSSLQ